MIRTTRAQRVALKKLFDRGPIFTGGSADHILHKRGWTFGYCEEKLNRNDPDACWWVGPSGTPVYRDSAEIVLAYGMDRPWTYREFRRRAVPYGDGSLVIGWHGITIGIERDGYTHS
jgi:hypothetical protein